MKKKQLLLFLMILFPFIANAHDIEVNLNNSQVQKERSVFFVPVNYSD